MKVFNLTFLSLGFALASVFGICYVGEMLLGADTARFVVVIPALLIGMNARKIMQKILGYTMEEALKGQSNDEQK